MEFIKDNFFVIRSLALGRGGGAVVILHVNSLKDYAVNLKSMPIFYQGSKIICAKTFSESNEPSVTDCDAYFLSLWVRFQNPIKRQRKTYTALLFYHGVGLRTIPPQLRKRQYVDFRVISFNFDRFSIFPREKHQLNI